MKSKFFGIIVIGFLFLGCASKAVKESPFTEWLCIPFPELTFKQTLYSDDGKYLGLSKAETFSIKVDYYNSFI